ncbi:MAG: ribosome recycling factor [Clostridia bacterium]|nr:ribosome recycling factor [Clostridia bacterium]
MDIDELFLEYEEGLEKAYNHQVNEYLVIRAGRANPHILDKITVDYYGVPTPIVQMGTVTVSEARILCVNIWDQSQIKNVVKAISASDIGITPTDDGKIIRLIFPTLTEERRKEIVKNIKKIAEDTKVTMRGSRRDCLDSLKNMKKDSLISEDEFNSYEKDVQKSLDDYIAKVDKTLENKEKEIMEI